MHSQFRGMMLSPAFPCLGGVGAVRRGDYRFAVYRELGHAQTVAACAGDLMCFVNQTPIESNPVAAFVAVFCEPVLSSDEAFELALWNQLKGMLEVRKADSGPEPASSDVATHDGCDPGFYFGDREFFVVGLHPASSRWARRFAWPTLVFNALTHAEDLQRRGKHAQLREQILARDRALQGSDNPSLTFSQFAQFSGRAVDDHWKCPVNLD
jgi:FPC/CPF motif-containing protein YcgG